MAYGFLAKNQYSDVIISSQSKNLHYVGKASLDRTIKSIDTYGGLRRWVFKIDLFEAVTPVVFHSVPAEAYYGVVRMSALAGGTSWEIEIIRSGTSATIPEVYVFSELTVAHQQKYAQESYGFLVMNDTAGITYDSRFKPLLIRAGLDEIKPPTNPVLDSAIPAYTAYYCGSDSSAGLTPTESLYYNDNLTSTITKPIISYQSISQSAKQYMFNASTSTCEGFNVYGACIGGTSYESWSSQYWAFWRAGVKLQLNTPTSGQYRVTAGWITTEWGCNYTQTKESKFLWFKYDVNSTQAGQWPLNNESINNNFMPIMISDGSLYD